MNDQVRPPYSQPTGPINEDEVVVLAFVRGLYAGHSPHFHVEGDALMVDRIDVAALRVGPGPGTILVRSDLDDDQLQAKPGLERVLHDEGLRLLEEDCPLGTPVAIQVLGMRMSSWDLWGLDLADSTARLQVAAVGDDYKPIF